MRRGKKGEGIDSQEPKAAAKRQRGRKEPGWPKRLGYVGRREARRMIVQSLGWSLQGREVGVPDRMTPTGMEGCLENLVLKVHFDMLMDTSGNHLS